jgi:diaminopropionate ammonia-lyase
MQGFLERARTMLRNPARTPCSTADRLLVGQSHAAAVRGLLDLCPAHCATPLLPLPALAARCGVGHVHVKGEWARMGLGSFKALGGVHAVALLVRARAQAALGRPVAACELLAPNVRALAAGITVVCASAGNHGLAVAAGARLFGAQAVVCLAETVDEAFALRLRAKGARVLRAGADYEASVAHASALAAERGWVLVPDTTTPGCTDMPLAVMRGYSVLFEEAADALERDGGPVTHVFVQAGVGGLAAAAAGYLRDRWGERFTFVVIEPEGAPCLLESVRHGRCVRAGTTTALGRLDCKEPSTLAYELLARLVDAFLLITDGQAEAAAAELALAGAPVSACGAAGAAGLIAACADAELRRTLALDADARVLLVGTEAAQAY